MTDEAKMTRAEYWQRERERKGYDRHDFYNAAEAMAWPHMKESMRAERRGEKYTDPSRRDQWLKEGAAPRLADRDFDRDR